MKKYVSLISLFASGTLYKLIGIFTLSAVIQTGLFVYKIKKNSHLIYGNSLASILDSSGIIIVYLMCVALFAAVLSTNCCDFGGKRSYTLRRLRIKESGVFLCYGAYSSLSFLLLYFGQMLVCVALSLYYIFSTGKTDNQYWVLSVYTSRIFRNFMPFDDVIFYISNLSLFVNLGISTASTSFLNSRGKKSFSVIEAVLAAVISQFAYPVYGNKANAVLSVAYVLISTVIIVNTLRYMCDKSIKKSTYNTLSERCGENANEV